MSEHSVIALITTQLNQDTVQVAPENYLVITDTDFTEQVLAQPASSTITLIAIVCGPAGTDDVSTIGNQSKVDFGCEDKKQKPHEGCEKKK